jgi:hypothetical protein
MGTTRPEQSNGPKSCMPHDISRDNDYDAFVMFQPPFVQSCHHRDNAVSTNYVILKETCSQRKRQLREQYANSRDITKVISDASDKTI